MQAFGFGRPIDEHTTRNGFELEPPLIGWRLVYPFLCCVRKLPNAERQPMNGGFIRLSAHRAKSGISGFRMTQTHESTGVKQIGRCGCSDNRRRP